MLTTEQTARSRLLVQLMAGAQAGDKEAFRTLVNEIGPALTNFVRRRIVDAAELEDVCQEILIQIYESRHTYDVKRPLEPWLFAIARYVVSDHRRRYLQRATHQQLTDAVADTAGEDQGSVLTRLRQAFSHLPPFQREALMMTKIEGLSIAESSQRAGTSTANMKVRVHRAAALLKKAILD
jgi:RNA polymerase sigma-70 factor, ECF subfamily